jgi:hypothetical protein
MTGEAESARPTGHERPGGAWRACIESDAYGVDTLVTVTFTQGLYRGPS